MSDAYVADDATVETSLRSVNNLARAALHYRLNRQLTQAMLAELAQTTQARVSDIESLKCNPRIDTLCRVADALGCVIVMVPKFPESMDSEGVEMLTDGSEGEE